MQSKHAHGEGASPALLGDTLIVNWDHEEQSFVVAFDKTTGDEKWKVNRNEVTSWSSPIAIDHNGRSMAIVAGSNRIRAYDLKDGTVLWSCSGLSKNVCATPIYSDGIVLIGSSYDTRNFLAIDIDNAKGDLTGTKHVLWSSRMLPPYVPSPLLYRGAVYYHRHYQGVLSRIEARSGKPKPGPMRLPTITDVYGSPVAADGIFVTDLRHGSSWDNSDHGRHWNKSKYLNTDLDLVCDIDPALVSEFESRDLFVHVRHEGEQFHVLCEAHNAPEPEPNIETLLDAIDALPVAARAIWNRCSLREFNVGYNCGDDPHSFIRVCRTRPCVESQIAIPACVSLCTAMSRSLKLPKSQIPNPNRSP